MSTILGQTIRMAGKAARLRSAAARLTGLALTGLALTGCHSPFVEATLVNHSGQPVRLVELDYPSASFGTQTLPAGNSFHYRFKVIGEGPVKLSWTDMRGKEHNVEGPRLHEGQEGLLNVTLGPDTLAWQTTFH